LCPKFHLEACCKSYREIANITIYQSVQGVNFSLQVIYFWKKGSYSAVFKAVQAKLLCLKFNLEAVRKSCREIASIKHVSVRGINILLRVIDFRKKECSYTAVKGKLIA
jgi:hypothetical protein